MLRDDLRLLTDDELADRIQRTRRAVAKADDWAPMQMVLDEYLAEQLRRTRAKIKQHLGPDATDDDVALAVAGIYAGVRVP